jgi:CDP-paratose 2-epimerase
MGLGKVLITGSCGLVGSEAVRFFADMGCIIYGIDNDNRGRWFGQSGSIKTVEEQLSTVSNYKTLHISILNKLVLAETVKLCDPDLIIHCAAQPSHEKSAEIPFEDFMVNATGTINLLEAAREHCPNTPFIHLSTNKVYGDRPNQIHLRESISRFHYDDSDYIDGIDENMPIDQCTHSPFGASKAAADLIVQEYGRYYGMPTVCFRCGCITGANHQGVEQHGFLSYLCKTAKQEKIFKIYGYGGKQVRDIIHVSDLVLAFYEYMKKPRPGEVYNIGGGFENSCSILEAIWTIKDIAGIEVKTTYWPARKGDHICYYTNFNKFKSHYPSWGIKRDLQSIFEELLIWK